MQSPVRACLRTRFRRSRQATDSTERKCSRLEWREARVTRYSRRLTRSRTCRRGRGSATGLSVWRRAVPRNPAPPGIRQVWSIDVCSEPLAKHVFTGRCSVREFGDLLLREQGLRSYVTSGEERSALGFDGQKRHGADATENSSPGSCYAKESDYEVSTVG